MDTLLGVLAILMDELDVHFLNTIQRCAQHPNPKCPIFPPRHFRVALEHARCMLGHFEDTVGAPVVHQCQGCQMQE